MSKVVDAIASASFLRHRKSALLSAVVGAMVWGAWAPAQVQTCPGQGPLLSLSGGRIGDNWSAHLGWLPGAPAILATDTAPGPVFTSVGSVCLGLSPAVATLAVSLDASGAFAASGVLSLANPFPGVTTLYVQAAVADPAYPAGAALSNAFAMSFRPPRIVACMQVQWFPGGPLIPGQLTFIDPVSDAVAGTTTLNVGDARKISRIPVRGGFAVPMSTPAVVIADDTTGATVATIGSGLGSGSNSWQPLAVSADGSFLVLQSAGGISLVSLTAVAIPSGAIMGSAVLPTSQPALWIGVGPGTQSVWEADAYWIRFANVATGAVASVLAPGAINGLVAFGNQLYFTTTSGLHACDLSTHVVSGPLASPTSGKIVAVGPGPGGPTAFLVVDGAANSTLAAVSLQTLAVQTVQLPAFFDSILLTAGGTEWLLELGTLGALSRSLVAMNASSLQSSTVLPSIMVDSMGILRSDTLRKAYVLTTPMTAIAIPTDPIGTPGPSIALPFPAVTLQSN